MVQAGSSCASRRFKCASPTGTIAGERSERGKNLPTACISASGPVFGAKVNTIEPLVRAAKPLITRTTSAAS